MKIRFDHNIDRKINFAIFIRHTIRPKVSVKKDYACIGIQLR